MGVRQRSGTRLSRGSARRYMRFRAPLDDNGALECGERRGWDANPQDDGRLWWRAFKTADRPGTLHGGRQCSSN